MVPSQNWNPQPVNHKSVALPTAPSNNDHHRQNKKQVKQQFKCSHPRDINTMYQSPGEEFTALHADRGNITKQCDFRFDLFFVLVSF